jgi:putative nucleotidyltransferase-like protein
MAAFKSPISPEAAIVAGNLRVDGASAEVLQAFGAVGIQSILLKGPTTSRWLYETEKPRGYGDSDLLVRPADVAKAEQALAGLGFEPLPIDQEMPSRHRDHAIGWVREADAATVDLHRSLPGVGVDRERLWKTLSARSELFDVAGFPASALTIPGRAFHLAIHAAHDGVGSDKVMSELERALSQADESTWKAAAELAAELDAMATFAAGLRTLPAGRAVASALDLPTAQPVEVALLASTPPPVALGFDELARAEDWRARLGVLRHKVLPPPGYVWAWCELVPPPRRLQVWPPFAGRRPIGLVLAYAWRTLWLLRRAPAGLMAWRAARRRARA